MRILFALLLCGLATAAHAASSCKLIRIAEWRVNGQSGRLIVDGAINGQKVGVLLDTGARYSFIHRAAADRLGLVRQEARGYRAAGVGGETYVEYAVVDELKIGNATRKTWRVFVLGEHDLSAAYAFLLGYDFFEQADIEFDLANNAVRLFQPQDCKDVPLAYWSRTDVSEVRLEPDHERPGILFKAGLNGMPVIANLDSGTSASAVSRLVAANAGVTPGTPGSYASGKSGGIGASRPEAWIGAFESFSIGAETIRNPNILFTNLEISGDETGSRLVRRRELRDMLLGLDFLRSHRVFIAHSQGKAYFSYVGGRVFAPPSPEPNR